jgi:hypothetical protein
MTETTIRTGLKLDRRWLSCGEQPVCNTMASVPSRGLMAEVATRTRYELRMARSWLTDCLTAFSGPPGMELRTLDDDEVESPVDHVAILLRVPLPNSNDPSQVFPVGRLGYTSAPMRKDVDMLMRDVMRLMEALAMHEVREWMRFNGKHIVDPHPELN